MSVAPQSSARLSLLGRLRPSRLFQSLVAGFAVIFALATAAAAQAPTKVRIGYQRSSTLITVLKTNGELEKALAAIGVEVSWHEFTSGLPLLEAVNLGSIDFSADVADTVPVFAQAAGAKLVYVADEAPSPSAQAILVPAASPITTLEQLKGKKVGVTKSAGSHYLLLAALAKAGLSIRDITPAYLTPADARAAFVSGNIDAWVAWDPFLSSTQAQSGARILADGTGLASYKRYYLTTEDFSKRGGKVLQVLFDRLKATGEWVKANPAPAAEILAGLWGVDAATVERANARRSYKVGVVTPASLVEQQKIADVFFADGVLPKKVNTSDVAIWTPANP